MSSISEEKNLDPAVPINEVTDSNISKEQSVRYVGSDNSNISLS